MTKRLRERLEELYRATGGSDCSGWIYDPVAELLYALVKMFRPQLIVQTGHLWGKSACVMLEALTDGESFGTEGSGDKKFSDFMNERTPKLTGMMHSIDPNPAGVSGTESGIGLLNEWYGENFRFYDQSSEQYFSPEGKPLVERIMGFVDGDHSEEGCLLDLTGMKKLNAGLIVVDDTEWIPALGKIASKFAGENGYNFLNLPWMNGVGVLIK